MGSSSIKAWIVNASRPGAHLTHLCLFNAWLEFWLCTYLLNEWADSSLGFRGPYTEWLYSLSEPQLLCLGNGNNTFTALDCSAQ